MKQSLVVVLILLGVCVVTSAQSGANPAKDPSAPAARADTRYSGMYSFQREGEFLQVTIADDGNVTGFVSRYGDLESDKGEFLDHFFKTARLEGTKFTFKTETVHGVWFEFTGEFERGEGKQPGDEAYYALKGTLSEYVTDADNKTTSRTREVRWKSFPHDLGAGGKKPGA
jgi:hypothetical protein